jgi:hypothetical protein
MDKLQFFSFGYRCNSISILKKLNLTNESYPFDWVLSDIDVIIDCIKTNFEHFLNKKNYISKEFPLQYKINRKEKIHIAGRGINKGKPQKENVSINNYYNKNIESLTFYDIRLGLLHHDIYKDYEYYERCIKRFYEKLKLNNNKYYLYIHKAIDNNFFKDNKNDLYKKFFNFYNFLNTQTCNISGIYIILIQGENIEKIIHDFSNEHYKIYIIYCLDNFFDAGTPFINGDFANNEIIKIIKSLIIL